jgi:hypothetical protein
MAGLCHRAAAQATGARLDFTGFTRWIGLRRWIDVDHTQADADEVLDLYLVHNGFTA